MRTTTGRWSQGWVCPMGAGRRCSFLCLSIVLVAACAEPDEPVSAAYLRLGGTVVTASADAWVEAGRPDANHGSASTLLVDGSPAYESFLRFDVPSLSGPLEAAYLRLYVTNSSQRGVSVAKADSGWTEGSLTWNNRPASHNLLGETGPVTAGQWIEIDVTAGISGGGAHAFRLASTSSDGSDFASREGSNPPELVLFAETAPGSVATFAASADTHGVEGSATRNFGTSTELYVDGSPEMETYLRFTVSGIEGSVEEATLRLYVTNQSNRGPTVHRAAADWSESELTWNSRPSVGSLVAEVGSAQASTWLEIDVTSGVSGNGEVAFALVPTSSDGLDLSSREGANPPELVIRAGGDGTSGAPDVTPPAVTLTSPADDATLSGVVTLAANATDDIGVVQVDFRWDSESFGAPDSSSPYAFSWDTTLFTNGLYTLTAVARDAAGNETVSNLVNVHVDNGGDEEPPPPPPPGSGETLRVPEDYGSIQAAIDAAAHGDTVSVGHGRYSGGLEIRGKAIRLVSRFDATGSQADVEATILSGGSPIVEVASGADGTLVAGFTLTGGTKGVVAHAPTDVMANRFVDVGSDAMSYEGTGGTIRDNYFESSGDDAIDMDDPTDSVVENNTIIDSNDDGIELRNYDHQGDTYTIVFRGNFISRSGEDGIQLIDYPANSDRIFVVERNVIIDSTDVGLGLMDNGETREDFRAASLPERIYVFHNTFVGNRYGITGGDNLIAVNNIVAECETLGIKGIDGNSVAAFNLFHGNGSDHQSSNVDLSSTVRADPRLTSDYRLGSGSAAIDAGTATFVHRGETVLSTPTADYSGAAPDLGRFESP